MSWMKLSDNLDLLKVGSQLRDEGVWIVTVKEIDDLHNVLAVAEDGCALYCVKPDCEEHDGLLEIWVDTDREADMTERERVVEILTSLSKASILLGELGRKMRGDHMPHINEAADAIVAVYKSGCEGCGGCKWERQSRRQLPCSHCTSGRKLTNEYTPRDGATRATRGEG